MRGFLSFAAGFSTLFAFTLAFPQPQKIYGVNIGSWLVLEPWLLPNEWVAMGGQMCAHCQDCIASEFALVQANPNTADQLFANHWGSWFTEADVQQLKGLGINTVRIPLGFWIVEGLVEQGEYYAKGGMRYLMNGLRWLSDAGIAVILDHHALPGVAVPNQSLAGRCTSDIQFYTQHNYHRALIWTAVMTALSHTDTAFASVFSIGAVNEPFQNARFTPGYGDFQKNFVDTIRAVEDIICIDSTSGPVRSANISAAFYSAAQVGNYSAEVKSVLADTVPLLVRTILEYGSPETGQRFFQHGKDPLVTTFQDMSWQRDGPPNPALAVDGPYAFDNHVYYSFGGLAAANEQSYLTDMCNMETSEAATIYGEWSLGTNFAATDAFLKQWADAQKFVYGRSSGWLFWNFKAENSSAVERQWSYFKGVELGYLTTDPSAYNDPNVCVPYIKT